MHIALEQKLKNTTKTSKKQSLRVILLVLSSFSLGACSTLLGAAKLKIPVFVFRDNGIIRSQANEFISFDDPKIKEYVAIHNEDWGIVMEAMGEQTSINVVAKRILAKGN